jgi:hypothetical protein
MDPAGVGRKARIRRTWGASEQKIIAARQGWRCAMCNVMLPSAYECDHRIPLWDGGVDCYETNAQALCGSCHCQKTQRENLERRIQEREDRITAILAARARSPIPASDESYESYRIPHISSTTPPLCKKTITPTAAMKRTIKAIESMEALEADIDTRQDNPFIKYAYVPQSMVDARTSIPASPSAQTAENLSSPKSIPCSPCRGSRAIVRLVGEVV